MVACIAVTNEKIRAEVSMGGSVIAKTPFVKSFNIQEARSQISATFSCSIEVEGGSSFPTGENVSIAAGTRGNLVTRFTGQVEKTQVKPVFGKPSYYLLIMSGRGVLSVLENKTFSRRLPANSEGVYCMITKGPSIIAKGKAIDKKVKSGNHSFLAPTPNPSSGTGENSPLVVHNKGGSEGSSKGGLTGHLASAPSNVDSQDGGGLGVHDHSDIEQGGPAFGVYSAD